MPPPPPPSAPISPFAQFVTLSPYPGTVDFDRWEKGLGATPPTIAGVPLTRRWLIPQALRPKLYWDHPVMTAEEIRSRTQAVWDNFYSLGSIWKRSRFHQVQPWPAGFRPDFKIYRQMYADTGIATDSARVSWSGTVGALAGQALSPPLRGNSHARS